MKMPKLLIWICCILIPVASIYFYPVVFVSGQTLYRLGMDNYIQGNHGDAHSAPQIIRAANYFEEAINKGYKQRDVFTHLTHCYKVLGDYVNADQAYTKALCEFPNDAEFYFYRASCRQDLRRHRDALLDYAMTIKLDTNFAYLSDAYFHKGAMEYILGDTIAADKDRSMAIKINRDSKGYQAYDNYCQVWR